ncbi:MAG: FAD-dependent oxidoreductase [Pseudomonadota bacterium]
MATDAPRHLVLLGAGHAHLQVLVRLARLSRARRAQLRVTLVSPYPLQLYASMLPGFVAGHYTLADCTINLNSLIAASGVEFLQCRATRVDAAARKVEMVLHSNLHSISYDVLSLDTGAVLDRNRVEQVLPGAREHALFLRPLENFAAQWERLCTLPASAAQRMVVVGGGASGVELALALKHRLPQASVSLLSGPQPPAAAYPAGPRKKALRALHAAGIVVLQKTCSSIAADQLTLDDGSTLACDVPLLALGAQAPAWLARSGLTLDGEGFLAVNPWQQSLSHPEVFGAGDVTSRADIRHPKSGVYALEAAQVLAGNLLAAAVGGKLKIHRPPEKTLTLLSCGSQTAIASWGRWSAQGAWVWRWKDRRDQRFVRKYRNIGK